MNAIERRIAALEAANPTERPMKVLIVPVGKDRDQTVAEYYESSGYSDGDVQLLVVTFVAPPRRDKLGNRIESATPLAEQSAP